MVNVASAMVAAVVADVVAAIANDATKTAKPLHLQKRRLQKALRRKHQLKKHAP